MCIIDRHNTTDSPLVDFLYSEMSVHPRPPNMRAWLNVELGVLLIADRCYFSIRGRNRRAGFLLLSGGTKLQVELAPRSKLCGVQRNRICVQVRPEQCDASY